MAARQAPSSPHADETEVSTDVASHRAHQPARRARRRRPGPRLPALFHAKAAGRCDLDALAGKDGGDMVLEAVSVAHSAVHVGREASSACALQQRKAAPSGACSQLPEKDFAYSHHLRPDPPRQPAPGRGAAGTSRAQQLRSCTPSVAAVSPGATAARIGAGRPIATRAHQEFEVDARSVLGPAELCALPHRRSLRT